MADFKTHIATSSLLGLGYGAGAYYWFGVPATTSILAGGLCGVSGMLPDLDSGPGRPLRESMAFAAAVISMMLMDRFEQLGLATEMIVLAGAGVYLTIRFGVAALLRHYTTHRGMFHSLPAALIAGEVAFLLVSGDVRLRLYKAGAVVLGYVSHLVLDELYSIEWYRGRIRFKQSFGTGLKVLGHDWWPNLSTYAKLAFLTWVVVQEPGWMDRVRQHRQELQPGQPAASAEHRPAPGQPGTSPSGPGESPATELTRKISAWFE